MKTLKVLAAAAALSVLSTPAAFAMGGPSGFNTPAVNTVADVERHAYDDQYVTLRGALVNYLGHERYLFADSTGTIEVELDDDYDWSYVSKDMPIELVGKVDKDFLSTSIDVKRITPLNGTQAPAPANAVQGFAPNGAVQPRQIPSIMS